VVDRATEIAVRIGVVGAGWIGRRHAQYCAEEPAAVLVGIADPANDAASLAHEFGVPHYRSLENMLDAQRVDGIIVAVPTPLHFKVAMTAIQRGIAVLIEKPITEHPAEVTELIATANSTGAKILVGHHRRHNPVVQQARDIVRSELGRLLAVSVLWAVLKPHSYFEPHWRRVAGAGLAQCRRARRQGSACGA